MSTSPDPTTSGVAVTTEQADAPLEGQAEKIVVVATANQGKLAEIRSALNLDGWRFVAAPDLGPWEPPEETCSSFAENALLKARHAAETFGYAALADDSGLEVDVLGGEPGVWSSRYSGPHATDAQNNRLLLTVMHHVPADRRNARFRCVVAFVDESGTETLATGVCEGRIGYEPRGDGGFGYDPIFFPRAGAGYTMAELNLAEKNSISHRGAALRDLKAKLEE